MASKRLLHCSFCGKAQTEVKKLIEGPGVFICDECVGLCQDIIVKSPARRPRYAVCKVHGVPKVENLDSLLPDNAPTENLLKMLAGYNGAFERVDAAMQDVVDILREREVSWAAIGESLKVSRQAAWKRFG